MTKTTSNPGGKNMKILSVPPIPSIVYTHYKFHVDYFLIQNQHCMKWCGFLLYVLSHFECTMILRY